jgi:dextranase
MIKDVYPLKAQYMSEELIEIAIEIVNEQAAAVDWLVNMSIGFLNENVEQIVYEIKLAGNEERTIIVNIIGKTAEFNGYGVDIDLVRVDNGARVNTSSTSFDVVSDWRKSTRYGFLADFHTRELGDGEDVKWLRKMHLNLVQFYDWMYKHDDLVAKVSVYTDLMGRDLNLDVVKEKVALCHQYGMKALAYGAVYAASKSFAELHPDWALYQSNGLVYDFINIFTIMNIAEQSPWHAHIIAEYKRAIEEVDFDGIHLDTYGFPKTGVSHYGGLEKVIRLDEHFPVLIDHTRDALEASKQDIALIFNNVGNWPVESVASSSQDVIYIEVWKPHERYHHIREVLQWAQHVGKGKPVILAAYLQAFRTDPNPDRAHNGALFLTAIISAHGGYHLLAGENSGVLTQAYYVDYFKVNDAFARRLRDYYDFNIRYANLLYAGELKDVSMTHADGDNLEYVFEDLSYSTYGEAGKVWTVIRESISRKTIHFINLTNNEEDYWNQGKNNPTALMNIRVRILLEHNVTGVYTASPDRDFGRPQNLAYIITDSLRGKTLEVTLPTLDYWTFLCIDL